LRHELCKGLGLLTGLVVLATPAFISAQVKSSTAQSPDRAALSEKIVRYLRERFGVPETVKLTVGAFKNSFDPNLFDVAVTVDDGKEKKEQKLLVSKDGRHLIVGEVYNLSSDPTDVAMRAISTRDQPAQGPPEAPVTIVEYADLECPMCARLHEFLESDLLGKYANKVRIVFKEFPLVAIHDWAQRAALASQCAYQINPGAFVAYRSLVFRNQSSINATNSRDMLLNLAAQAGIDSLKLAACLDSQASRPRVEEDIREGKQIGVVSTPTCYVNGRMIVGMPGPETFYRAVEEALHARQ
jgi:protein-disulfide isomerase